MNPPGPWGCRTATVEGGPRGRCLLPAHAAEAVPQTLSGASQVPSAHPTLHGPSKGWRLACRRAGRNERRRCQEIPHIPGSLVPGPARRVQLGTSRTRGGPTPALGRWGTTDRTVQLEKRKSWGGQHPKTGKERVGGGQGAWREERRLETMTAGEGSALGLGSPPPTPPARSRAQLRGFPGRERFGSLAPINSHELVHPASSALAEAPDRAEGWGASCDTPPRDPAARGGALPHPAGGARAGTHSPLPACPRYETGFQMGGSLRANLGRHGYRFAFAGKPTSASCPDCLRAHSARESFGVPAAPPSRRGPESPPFGPRRRGGKFVRPELGDR